MELSSLIQMFLNINYVPSRRFFKCVADKSEVVQVLFV